MDEYCQRVRDRLDHIWEPADFSTLFTNASQYPIQFIKKGTILFNTGDPLGRLYYIKDGYIKIYRLSEEGKETTNYLLGPGNVLGIRTLLTKEDRTKHTAETITEIKAITISRQECFEALTKHPEFLIDLLQVFRDRLAYTEQKFESFIYANATARVAIFLADCARRFGIEKNGEITIDLELTHQGIADFVGAFRETVTNSVHRLEDEKIITMKRGKITVLNMEKLNAYSSFNNKRR